MSLIIASKIWDDESFENSNFSKAFPAYSISDINKMETIFLKCIDYDLYIKSSDYAKYYYILRVLFLNSHFLKKVKRVFPCDL